MSEGCSGKRKVAEFKDIRDFTDADLVSDYRFLRMRCSKRTARSGGGRGSGREATRRRAPIALPRRPGRWIPQKAADRACSCSACPTAWREGSRTPRSTTASATSCSGESSGCSTDRRRRATPTKEKRKKRPGRARGERQGGRDRDDRKRVARAPRLFPGTPRVCTSSGGLGTAARERSLEAEGAKAPEGAIGIFLAAEGRRADDPRFHRLALDATFRENLNGKRVLEFPTLHVAVLPEDEAAFPLVPPETIRDTVRVSIRHEGFTARYVLKIRT